MGLSVAICVIIRTLELYGKEPLMRKRTNTMRIVFIIISIMLLLSMILGFVTTLTS